MNNKEVTVSKDNRQCHHEKHRYSSAWIHSPEKIFETVEIKKGSLFLDLGCGQGDYSIYVAGLKEKAVRVLALDIRQELIDNIRVTAQERKLDNLKAVACDITDSIPLPDNSVDICLAATILHALKLSKIKDRLFNEIHRVLKPEGRFMVVECKKEETPCGPPMKMRIALKKLSKIISQYSFVRTGVEDLGMNYLVKFVKI